MSGTRIKSLARTFGIGAIGIAIAVNLGPSHALRDLAGGSGDSPTTGGYTSPAVPAMKLNPSNMSLGATATFTPPAATMATSEAAPSVRATPAQGCVNNGQCP